MLEELRLENFRGFGDHTIPFTDLTLLVGRNNAGKSTVVEALRLVSAVTSRLRGRAIRFNRQPAWLDDPRGWWGIAPGVRRDFDFQPETFFHRYGDPPACVTARFTGGSSIELFVGPGGDLHGVVRDAVGQAVSSGAEARGLDVAEIRVQPQVGPVPRNDYVLAPVTVERGLGTSLSPLHFRNQLNLFYRDHFAAFKEIAEATWPLLQILELQGRGAEREAALSLLIREADFSADVGLMGHGLQMWLQLIWFVAQAPRESTVVLDEPDVYMHPDLQHRLVEFIEGRYRQVIITTHSVEIIATSDPSSLVLVDRADDRSAFAMSLPAAQAVIENLGGVYSLDVARLFRSQRFLLVEGEDVPILHALQRTVIPNARVPMSNIPKYETGGWGGWRHAVASPLPEKNGEGKKITVYAIFDRDYFPPSVVATRYEEAEAKGVRLHVWRRKEIENYLLVPAAIARVIAARHRKGTPPSVEEVEAKLDEVVDALREETTEAIADYLQQEDRRFSVKGALAQAKRTVVEEWQTREGRCAIVGGKSALAGISRWAQATYGAGFTAVTVAKALSLDEVDHEVQMVLTSIDSLSRFGSGKVRPQQPHAPTT